MAPSTTRTADNGDAAVQLRSVTVAFGGLLALGGVDLDVAQGERLAILGPNGAGKTTLFNVVAGDLAPTQGTVRIKGVDCAHLPSRYRPRLGVARTYQKARSFPGLTVEDNLYLALVGRPGQAPVAAAAGQGRSRAARARGRGRCRRSGSTAQLGTLVSELSHGQKRQLEIGMALATDPDVLLLDEPASGLSRGERERLTELLHDLPAESTLLLIEHDMDVAFQVGRRVVVMSDGKLVASGTPDEIQANALVHEIYLGSEALSMSETPAAGGPRPDRGLRRVAGARRHQLQHGRGGRRHHRPQRHGQDDAVRHADGSDPRPRAARSCSTVSTSSGATPEKIARERDLLRAAGSPAVPRP